MQVFGKGFGQTIAHRLQQDGVVIIPRRLVGIGNLGLAKATADRKGADPVGDAALFGRHKIRQTIVGEHIAIARLADLVGLLAQTAQHLFDFTARLVGIDLDIVTDPVGREQPQHAGHLHLAAALETIQHRLGIGKQALGLLAHHLVFEDARILASQLPAQEEGGPVDVVTQGGDIHLAQHMDARQGRFGRLIGAPVARPGVGAGGFQRDGGRAWLLAGMLLAHRLVLLGQTRHIVRLELA